MMLNFAACKNELKTNWFLRVQCVGARHGVPVQCRAGVISRGAGVRRSRSESQDREVGTPGAGEKGICRKDVKNRGNELKDLLKTKDVKLCSVQKRTENELVFACKKEQINAIWDQLRRVM